MSRLLLAGDLGGTKSSLAVFVDEGGARRPLRGATLRSGEFPSAAALVGAFLGQGRETVDAACLGIAGPVRGGRVATPNLPWIVDARELETTLGLGRVTLLNDLVVTALGVAELPDDRFCVLQEGLADPEGNAALIAAGTGLGQALLLRSAGRLVPSPSEGGHGGFAPETELEADLLRFLAAELGHVSVERVVSGPGLRNIYRFLTTAGREAASPRVRDRMEQEDPSAVIAQEALAGTDGACALALEVWCRAYGAEAGNLALRALATAGLSVGGGIAPKVLPALREGGFLEAFRSKGRLSDLLAEVPVRVVLDPGAALYGAACCAAACEEP